MEYATLEDVKRGTGLRLVLMKGRPCPWSQAAKSLFEVKGVPFVVAPQFTGEANGELVAWTGQGSAPVVVWNDDHPVTHWLDILNLAERIAPEPGLIPKNVTDRVLMVLNPDTESNKPSDLIKRMADRYHYYSAETEQAAMRTVGIMRLFSDQFSRPKAQDSDYLIGTSVTAVDIYWTAFMNLLKPYGDDIAPLPLRIRELTENVGPLIKAALKDCLFQHRDFIFQKYFRSPMDY